MNWRTALLLAATASLPAKNIQPPPWETSPLTIGRDLFRENCAVCHDIDKDQKHTKKLGPSLHHLFKNERMPLSRGKPNRPYVVIRIKFGGALMPAFGHTLNDSEIQLLVDYIASK